MRTHGINEVSRSALVASTILLTSAWSFLDADAATHMMSASSDQPVESVIRVDAASTLADAELFPGWVRDRNPGIAGRIPDTPGHEQWISVDIGGNTFDYTITVTAMRDGQPVTASGGASRCECTSEALLELIDQEIAEAVEELRSSPIQPTEPAAPLTASPTLSPERVSDPPAEKTPRRTRSDRSPRLGAMGYTGIGLAVVGAGSLGAGIALLLRPPDKVMWVDSRLEERSTQVPGAVIAVAGGMALASGLTLAIVDAVRHRQGKVALLPSVGQGFAGFAFDARF